MCYKLIIKQFVVQFDAQHCIQSLLALAKVSVVYQTIYKLFTIKKVSSVKFLGLYIQENLSWR